MGFYTLVLIKQKSYVGHWTQTKVPTQSVSTPENYTANVKHVVKL